ncbi:hypothetical protein GWO43_24635 [candidate division KSB1 bacterium]|nr:hypothetical protein [candidate division KSB1 bacterium]NIR68574.1 hypothetical protein [candidate division KSB1 bacterium]NIS27118.1 hypothetical protein [candidate division KSB1 bacterium]NIT74004.1 hypothetical protein [candidate division KSB1 bacterium]NIU27865.1 hypothetical protein [candidate division KSB1 bacterium]
MDKLHAKYIKIVTTGGDLDAATEIKLAQDTVTIKHTGAVVEHKHSQNPNPDERTEWGTEWEIRGVFSLATQSELVTLLGGSENANVYTKTQGIRTLSNYDVRIAVYRASDGLLVLKDVTKVNFMPEVEESYEAGSRFYLPFMMKSTDTSDYTSDNSAV